MRTSLAILAVFAASAVEAQAGTGSTKTISGTASAQAIAPLVLVHWTGNQLSFGRFTAGSAGTVSVSGTSGAGSTTGGATFVSGSPTSMDYFIASGDPNRLIGIVTGGGNVTAGGNSMSFTTVPMLTAGFLPGGGAGFFTVGGTLNVAAGQAAGSYTGSYSVTVTYQ